jgi:hypothetical protein
MLVYKDLEEKDRQKGVANLEEWGRYMVVKDAYPVGCA